MKNLIITLSICFLMIACKKSDPAKALPEDNGCITQVTVPLSMHTISAVNVAIVNNLFLQNNIDNHNFRYYQYLQDSLQTSFPPYLKVDNKTVRIDQYINGLRVFTGDLVFNFRNNVFYNEGGDMIKATTLDLDTISNLTLGQLRKLFIDNVEQFDHKNNQYKDSCLNAEFGYYNLNAGISYATVNLVKAWKVTLKRNPVLSSYPVAFYKDDSGGLIYYFNGITTFK